VAQPEVIAAFTQPDREDVNAAPGSHDCSMDHVDAAPGSHDGSMEHIDQVVGLNYQQIRLTLYPVVGEEATSDDEGSSSKEKVRFCFSA
jgi:hypothetical protein